MAKKKPEIVEHKVFIEEYESGWKNEIVNNPFVSVGLPILVGTILFSIFK